MSEVYRKKEEGDGGSVGVCKRGGKQKGIQGEQENANSCNNICAATIVQSNSNVSSDHTMEYNV